MKPLVTQQLECVFRTTLLDDKDLFLKWEEISKNIGSLLPDSNLRFSVEQLGLYDLLLRRLENEFPQDDVVLHKEFMLTHNFFLNFSEVWVSLAYEIFRGLRERKLASGERFEKISNDLRLIRISLQKFQLAKENKLKGESIEISLPEVEMEDIFDNKFTIREITKTYSTGENNKGLRTFTLPTMIKDKRTVAWQVIDIENPQQSQIYWLDRRDLSDRILDLWSE